MKPAYAQFTENMIEIKILRRCFGDCGIGSVRTSHRPADAKAPLRKVNTVSAHTPDTVRLHPLDQRCIHTALQNEILHQHAHFIIRKSSDHARLHAKASAQAAHHIVLSAALPGAKLPCRPDPSLTRVQPQHDLSERNRVIPALAFRP